MDTFSRTRDLLSTQRPTALETLVKSAKDNAGMRLMVRRCLENIGWTEQVESSADDRKIV